MPETTEIATSDDLRRIAYQPMPLTLAMGDKLTALANALDALREAKQRLVRAEERDRTEHVFGEENEVGFVYEYPDCPTCNEIAAAKDALEQAIATLTQSGEP